MGIIELRAMTLTSPGQLKGKGELSGFMKQKEQMSETLLDRIEELPWTSWLENASEEDICALLKPIGVIRTLYPNRKFFTKIEGGIWADACELLMHDTES